MTQRVGTPRIERLQDILDDENTTGATARRCARVWLTLALLMFTAGCGADDSAGLNDQTYRAVVVEAVFEQRMVDIRFVFDENERVSGLFFEQHPQPE
ncbi:MAG: hypothetical protein JW990_00495 [Thermoleophilia bacterium]|nr:hypothetical protein [Thermoleophilia bacterium]